MVWWDLSPISSAAGSRLIQYYISRTSSLLHTHYIMHVYRARLGDRLCIHCSWINMCMSSVLTANATQHMISYSQHSCSHLDTGFIGDQLNIAMMHLALIHHFLYEFQNMTHKYLHYIPQVMWLTQIVQLNIILATNAHHYHTLTSSHWSGAMVAFSKMRKHWVLKMSWENTCELRCTSTTMADPILR